MEQDLVERAGIEYRGVSSGQLRGKNPLTTARNAGKMMSGIRQSNLLLGNIRPHVCLVTGGYVCAPVVVACRQKKTPVLIYLPDMSPGSAIRWLSRLAQRVAVSFEGAAAYFGGTVSQGGKAVVTGYPVRPELVLASADRRAARHKTAELLERPSLAPAATNLPMLLVWGGSQGSRSINQATWDALPHLLPLTHIVHVIGKRDWEMSQPLIEDLSGTQEWQPSWTGRYHPVDYLHEAMLWALAAADLTVARAGASILGEFPTAGLPSILVPLPIAGVNQQLNAQALEQHGAATIINDSALGDELAPVVQGLLEERNRLQAMERAVRGLAKPGAAASIVRELERLCMHRDESGRLD